MSPDTAVAAVDAPAAAEFYRARRYAAQDGLSLYFRDYGDPCAPDVPVLCLPGLTRNSSDFDGIARHLAAGGRRVIAVDYRGRGRSEYDPDWRNYRPETCLGDLRHLLAALGLERVAVIGTSMGGLLGAGFAVAMPAALAAVVINDVGPEIDPAGLAKIVAYLASSEPLAGWDAAIARLKAAFPHLPAYEDGDWMKIARGTYREGPDGRLLPDWDPAIVKPLLAGHGRPLSFWPLFRALRRTPTLILRGEKSDVLSAEVFERVGAALPDARRVVVPRVGHAPSLNEPHVRHAIDALLRDL